MRISCAEQWESVALHLYNDISSKVRRACLKWKSCHSVMIMIDEEYNKEILQA